MSVVLRIAKTPDAAGLYIVEKHSNIGELRASYRLDITRLRVLQQTCRAQHIPIEYVDVSDVAATSVAAATAAAPAREPAPFDASESVYSALGEPDVSVPAAPASGDAQNIVRMPYRHGGSGTVYNATDNC